MADKLDWLNQHPLWFVYPTVSQVVELNHLSLSTPLLALSQRFPVAEDYLKALWHEGRFKDACTFCAYNTTPRIAVWWAYSCVVDLTKELLLNPAQKVKIQDIAKPRPLNVPEWCNFDQAPKELTPYQIDALKKIDQAKATFKQAQDQLKAVLPKNLSKFIDDSINATFLSLKARCGYDIRDLFDEALKKYKDSPSVPVIDKENSPIFKAARELEQKVEKARLETVKLINSVVPEEDFAKESKVTAQCLDAVWAYITSPNENNAQTVFQLGNACPNLVEGLLASIAFWSYGSLTPNMEQVVKTPAGLMANGINGLLVKCATTLGGFYKPEERFERYFNLAFAALTNQSTWAPFVERHTSPHQEVRKEALERLGLSSTKNGQQEANNTQPSKDNPPHENSPYESSSAAHDSFNPLNTKAQDFSSGNAATAPKDTATSMTSPSTTSADEATPYVDFQADKESKPLEGQHFLRFTDNHFTASAHMRDSLETRSSQEAQSGMMEASAIKDQGISDSFVAPHQAIKASQSSLSKEEEVARLKQETDQKLQERLAKIKSDIQRRFRG